MTDEASSVRSSQGSSRRAPKNVSPLPHSAPTQRSSPRGL